MLRSAKLSLLILLGIALLLVGANLFAIHYLSTSSGVSLALFWIYAWMPGCIALFCASREGFHLATFARPNRYFYLALLISVGINLLTFFCAILFGLFSASHFAFEGLPVLTQIGNVLFYLFDYYLVFLLVFSAFSLGGELYWRGYLWEKVKANPYQAIWQIALIWSLWMIPPTLFPVASDSEAPRFNLAWMVAYNFVLSPILFYFRIQGKSIFTATLFYASFQATSIYLRMLFPSLSSVENQWVRAVGLVFLVLYAFSCKLYSRKFWKRLAGNDDKK